jgi:hypothetical protein
MKFEILIETMFNIKYYMQTLVGRFVLKICLIKLYLFILFILFILFTFNVSMIKIRILNNFISISFYLTTSIILLT